jgi:hypothetical protein
MANSFDELMKQMTTPAVRRRARTRVLELLKGMSPTRMAGGAGSGERDDSEPDE